MSPSSSISSAACALSRGPAICRSVVSNSRSTGPSGSRNVSATDGGDSGLTGLFDVDELFDFPDFDFPVFLLLLDFFDFLAIATL